MMTADQQATMRAAISCRALPRPEAFAGISPTAQAMALAPMVRIANYPLLAAPLI